MWGLEENSVWSSKNVYGSVSLAGGKSHHTLFSLYRRPVGLYQQIPDDKIVNIFLQITYDDFESSSTQMS
jgi:hypothetical protein